MISLALIGLMQLDLPTHTVRLTDGGFVVFGGQTFSSSDAVLGSIGSVETLAEGVGDEVPALQISFLPAASATAAQLSQPGFQKSRCRFWIGEYSSATGLLVGTPELLFDGQLDRTQLVLGQKRDLNCSVVSLAERLFEANSGNWLSGTWHKSIWPGELGHDNATGLGISVPWGAVAPPAAAPASGGYSGSGSGELTYWQKLRSR